MNVPSGAVRRVATNWTGNAGCPGRVSLIRRAHISGGRAAWIPHRTAGGFLDHRMQAHRAAGRVERDERQLAAHELGTGLVVDRGEPGFAPADVDDVPAVAQHLAVVLAEEALGLLRDPGQPPFGVPDLSAPARGLERFRDRGETWVEQFDHPETQTTSDYSWMAMAADPLASFTPQAREWFLRAFERPTEAQNQAWPAIAGGDNVLLSAPTGSGKTLAAFLWALDRLTADPLPEGERKTRLVYVSPLKALSYDIERNLRAPLKGIGGDIQAAIRTGDTPQKDRAQMLRTPPDVLITTPESLYLMLTSRAREILTDVEWVIVD